MDLTFVLTAFIVGIIGIVAGIRIGAIATDKKWQDITKINITESKDVVSRLQNRLRMKNDYIVELKDTISEKNHELSEAHAHNQKRHRELVDLGLELSKLERQTCIYPGGINEDNNGQLVCPLQVEMEKKLGRSVFDR